MTKKKALPYLPLLCHLQINKYCKADLKWIIEVATEIGEKIRGPRMFELSSVHTVVSWKLHKARNWTIEKRWWLEDMLSNFVNIFYEHICHRRIKIDPYS